MTAAAEVLSRYEIIREFRRSKSGLVWIAILLSLIIMTIYSAAAVPLESFRQWNSPNFWIDLPKAAAPAWTNFGFGPKVPEHMVLHAADDASISSSSEGGIRTVVHSYTVNFNYDNYPSDFMLLYSVRYGGTQPVHTLNGTMVTDRAVLALLENFGGEVPDALRPYGAPARVTR